MSACYLYFNKLCAGFDGEPASVANGLVEADVVRQERHIGCEAYIGRAAADGGGYSDHKVHSRGQCGVEAEH
jgi:hypothetical protein